MWLGERITDRGIGNGISLLIMIGIIAGLPQSLITEFTLALGTKVGGLVMFMVEMVTLLIVIMVSILLVQGTRRIPVQYAKRVIGNKQYGGVRQFIPLKVNAAGVMPIIFAQAIMFVPLTLAGFADSSDISNWFLREFSQFDGFWYNLTFYNGCVVYLFLYSNYC